MILLFFQHPLTRHRQEIKAHRVCPAPQVKMDSLARLALLDSKGILVLEVLVAVMVDQARMDCKENLDRLVNLVNKVPAVLLVTPDRWALKDAMERTAFLASLVFLDLLDRLVPLAQRFDFFSSYIMCDSLTVVQGAPGLAGEPGPEGERGKPGKQVRFYVLVFTSVFLNESGS